MPEKSRSSPGGRNVDKNSSTFFAEAPLGNVMLDFWGCAAG
jgi:hypothetical protein